MFAGVGERTREGNDLYREMIESVSEGHTSKSVTVALCDPTTILVQHAFWLLIYVHSLQQQCSFVGTA